MNGIHGRYRSGPFSPTRSAVGPGSTGESASAAKPGPRADPRRYVSVPGGVLGGVLKNLIQIVLLDKKVYQGR